MGWDVDIAHCRNEHLIDANYWSRLDANLCYDPSFHQYLHLVEDLQRNHPAPTEIPMDVQHMLHYQGHHIPNLRQSSDTSNVDAHNVSQVHAPVDVVNHAGATIVAWIVTSGDLGPTSLSHRPVQFSIFSSSDTPATKPISQVLYSSELTGIAYSTSHFPWAVYGFNSRHFVSTIEQCNLLAHGRALFREVVKCSTALPSAGALLDHIRGSGHTRPIDGFLLHSHQYQSSKPTATFWSFQASLLEQLYAIQNSVYLLPLSIPTMTNTASPSL